MHKNLVFMPVINLKTRLLPRGSRCVTLWAGSRVDVDQWWHLLAESINYNNTLVQNEIMRYSYFIDRYLAQNMQLIILLTLKSQSFANAGIQTKIHPYKEILKMRLRFHFTCTALSCPVPKKG